MRPVPSQPSPRRAARGFSSQTELDDIVRLVQKGQLALAGSALLKMPTTTTDLASDWVGAYGTHALFRTTQ